MRFTPKITYRKLQYCANTPVSRKEMEFKSLIDQMKIWFAEEDLSRSAKEAFRYALKQLDEYKKSNGIKKITLEENFIYNVTKWYDKLPKSSQRD